MKKEEQITIRVSKAEKGKIDFLAEQNGVSTSKFVRDAALGIQSESIPQGYKVASSICHIENEILKYLGARRSVVIEEEFNKIWQLLKK